MRLGNTWAVLAAVSLIAGTAAPPVQAQNAGRVATEVCQDAASDKVRRQQNVYGRVQYLGRAKLKQVSNAETGVSGTGQYEARRGWERFSYHCVYNIRNGRVTTNSVKYVASGSGSNNGNDSSMSTGQAVGTILGIAIAGAILNSMDKNGNSDNSDGGWWSPADGVKCNSYQSACYRNGKFNAQWTNRIYK